MFAMMLFAQIERRMPNQMPDFGIFAGLATVTTILIAIATLLPFVLIFLIVQTSISNWWIGPQIVVQEFDPPNWNAGPDEPLVYMKGRQGGLLYWILSFFDWAPTVTLEITAGEARLTRRFFSLHSMEILSLQQKPSVAVSESRRGDYLWLAIWALMVSIALVCTICVPIVGMFFVIGYGLAYFLSLEYRVTLLGYHRMRFRVYPSFLSGRTLKFEELLEVLDVIRRLIDRVPAPTIAPQTSAGSHAIQQRETPPPVSKRHYAEETDDSEPMDSLPSLDEPSRTGDESEEDYQAFKQIRRKCKTLADIPQFLASSEAFLRSKPYSSVANAVRREIEAMEKLKAIRELEKQWAPNGEMAKPHYENLVSQYDGTQAAKFATAILKKMQG